jgi:hypothetical protein
VVLGKIVKLDRHEGAPLAPALKEFIDAVLVPALVKEYLADHARENRLALIPEGVTQSLPTHSASAEGVL